MQIPQTLCTRGCCRYGCSLAFYSGTTNLELCKWKDEISITHLCRLTCRQDVSQHVGPCKGHFSYLPCSEITHLCNWINYNSIPCPDWTVLNHFDWSIRFTQPREGSGEDSVRHVRLDRVWKQHSPSCYSNNRRQRLRDQSSSASTDAMLLVAFTHWRGQAKFGMTLMCHLDLDTSSMLPTNVAWYLHACTCASVSAIGFA